jgi:hypothetical protein
MTYGRQSLAGAAEIRQNGIDLKNQVVDLTVRVGGSKHRVVDLNVRAVNPEPRFFRIETLSHRFQPSNRQLEAPSRQIHASIFQNRRSKSPIPSFDSTGRKDQPTVWRQPLARRPPPQMKTRHEPSRRLPGNHGQYLARP